MTAQLLHHLLTHSSETHPTGLAVADGEGRSTYVEIEAHANQIAWLLRKTRVKRGDRVGLYAEKTRATIAALYGIMKAGAVYVPLDPYSPTARLTTILRDCQAIHLLAGARLRDRWPALCAPLNTLKHLTVLDGAGGEPFDPQIALHDAAEVAAHPVEPPPTRGIDQDLAYILYTSGSTGLPKGVMLSHANGMAFVRWGAQAFQVTARDRLSNHAPLHFDLSVFDIFVAAHAGACVFLVPPRLTRFPAAIAEFIAVEELTIWYSVPSALTMLVERGGIERGDFPALRAILFAGEVFPIRHLRRLMRLLPRVRFANLYGPTETNVCTAYMLDSIPAEEATAIPIGESIENVDVLVVDGTGRPVPAGEVGELYVRGSTVMQGYWGASETSRQALVADPRGVSGDRCYRTGDLVRRRPDGNLEFLGRRDTQVKSRGYRIELGEIEAALHLHPEVTEAVALAVPDELQNNRIRAVAAVSETLTSEALRAFCAERLPPYMVPEEIDVRAELPKTSTGKVDRRALTG